MIQNKIYIYGRHALTEALRNVPLAVRHVYFSREMKDAGLRKLAQQSGVPVDELDSRKVTSWVERNAPHQGAVALISLGGLVIPFEEWIKASQKPSFPERGEFSAKNSPTSGAGAPSYIPGKLVSASPLVLLNGIQDPHNVGAIIRSAVAFGAGAVLLPMAKQSPVTGAVIKASAGLAFSMPLVSVTNLQKTISELKKQGYRVYGLSGDGKNSLKKEEFDKPAVFVMGNEAEGLGKVSQLCDKIISIPIEPSVESLNVAAAAAVTLYQWHTKRR